MKTILFVISAMLSFVVIADGIQEPYQYQIKAKLKNISDGDTAKISVRFYGIDTPEKKQKCEDANGRCYACGQTSKQALETLINNEEVTVKFTGDSTYGRVVASIEKNGKDVNLEMVKQGHAVAYLRFLKGDMKKRYAKAQKEAKDQKRGIWQGKFIRPSKWRNQGQRLSCEG